MQKVERNFSSEENFSSNRNVSGENTVNNTLRIKSLRNKSDSSSAQEIGMVDDDDREVTSPPKNRARTERASTPSKVITRGTKKTSDGSRLQERSRASAAAPPSTVDIITKITEEAKKTLEDIPRSSEAEYTPLIYFRFDDRLSGRAPPVYAQPSMAIAGLSRSWVLNCSQLACFCEVETNDKYKHVTPFLHAFILQNLHRANVFLSNQSVLFL